MIISEKKYIYMAVPKTGTTSIQSFLLKNDKSASKNKVVIEGNHYQFREHMTALGIKKVLGDLYSNYTVIGFVRHPYGRLVSGYHFYNQGGKGWAWVGRKKPTHIKLKLKLAKVLPFHIWALVYPYKSNREYFFDENDNLIVEMENIGLYENLSIDLMEILYRMDITLKNEIPHNNKSKHADIDGYFNNPFFKWLINLKVKRDMKFYNMVVTEKKRHIHK